MKSKKEKTKRKATQNGKNSMKRQRFITAIKNVIEGEKELKSLIIFHSANKIDNTGVGAGGEKKKKSKRIYRTSQNIRIINVFLESLLSESFSSLGVTVYLTSLR